MEREASFGGQIKARRKALDLTQEALAQRVGCALSTLKKIEAGVLRPSRQVAERLADRLELSLEERSTFVRLARQMPARGAATKPAGASSGRAAPQRTLPLPLTPLIGRASELERLRSILLHSDVRLLTITGPPGVGKTRLALQAAADLGDTFADGVGFVALAAISDPQLVPTAIAQVVGVRETSGQTLMESLHSYLHDKQLLLLLDNFEQVLAAAPLVAELLTAAPLLKALVTSRATLRLSGEHEFEAPPLALPNLQRLPLPAELARFAAVELFVERAQAVKADFSLTAANAPDVAAICTRLDGLPLAIELAAARIKLFLPAALLKRLDHRLALLTDAPRDLPPRHQTLRAAMAWSYDLLSEDEQRLFRRLGVFVGGCALDAIAAVCNLDGDRALDVVDGVAALLNQSLLQQDVGADGEPRFTMLETIREYARERLERSGELDNAQQQHAAYYLALAEQAAPQLDGREERTWLDRLAIEHDNLRAALQWGLEQDADGALRLAGMLAVFWQRRGHVSEGHYWLQETLDRVAILPDIDGESTYRRRAAQAKALIGLSTSAFQHGDSVAGLAACEASVRLYQELGDRRGLGFALAMLGFVAMHRGEMAMAERALAEAVAVGRAIGDMLILALALGGHSVVLLAQGDVATAHAECEESVRLARAAGAPWATAQCLRGLARIAAYTDHWSEARACCREALVLFRELGDQYMVNVAHSELAHMERRAGNLDAAQRLYQQSIAVLQELGQRSAIAYQLECFAFIARAQDQLAHAARLFGAAEALREALGTPLTGLERSEYDREVAGLRGQMDAEAYASSWAAGRALSLEQAIAEALQPRMDDAG
jgi:predicted ATPase/DNA-binding XRE family transcriptional regulator